MRGGPANEPFATLRAANGLFASRMWLMSPLGSSPFGLTLFQRLYLARVQRTRTIIQCDRGRTSNSMWAPIHIELPALLECPIPRVVVGVEGAEREQFVCNMHHRIVAIAAFHGARSKHIIAAPNVKEAHRINCRASLRICDAYR